MDYAVVAVLQFRLPHVWERAACFRFAVQGLSWPCVLSCVENRTFRYRVIVCISPPYQEFSGIVRALKFPRMKLGKSMDLGPASQVNLIFLRIHVNMEVSVYFLH